MCYECAKIPKDPIFRQRVIRKRKDLNSKQSNRKGSSKFKVSSFVLAHGERKNTNLSSKQTIEKLKEYRHKTRRQRLMLFRLSLKLCRSQKRTSSIRNHLVEHSRRGDVSAITYNLHKAYEKGLLSDKSKLITFLSTITSNFCKKSKGKRYDE